MSPGRRKRQILLLLASLAIVAGGPTLAAAAEPAVVELSAATHATSVAPAADGAVWFSLYHGSAWQGPQGPAIGRVAADGTVAELPVPLSGHPAPGPAGELWVSGARTKATGEHLFEIARLSPSGAVVKKYVVGRGKGGIQALAPTARAVWFVRFRSRGRGTIERLSIADGSLRQFALRPECRSNALAVAGDGAVWFTEVCPSHTRRGHSAKASRIGRIAPGGEILRRRLTGRGYPVSIALGADGTVWFGMTDLGYTTPLVGRITSAGALAEYRVRDGEPGSIAVGPEGRLWFPSSFGGGIYRALNSISASGHLADPICADPTCRLAPSALTAAADGSLWYALTEPHTIGGGGFTQIMEGETIENEAGFIGHLTP